MFRYCISWFYSILPNLESFTGVTPNLIKQQFCWYPNIKIKLFTPILRKSSNLHKLTKLLISYLKQKTKNIWIIKIKCLN